MKRSTPALTGIVALLMATPCHVPAQEKAEPKGRELRRFDTGKLGVIGLINVQWLMFSRFAAALIGKDPERYGLAGVERLLPVPTELVEVPGGTDLGLVARAVGLSLEQLRQLKH